MLNTGLAAAWNADTQLYAREPRGRKNFQEREIRQQRPKTSRCVGSQTWPFGVALDLRELPEIPVPITRKQTDVSIIVRAMRAGALDFLGEARAAEGPHETSDRETASIGAFRCNSASRSCGLRCSDSG